MKRYRRVTVIRLWVRTSHLASLHLLPWFHLYWLHLGRHFSCNAGQSSNGSKLTSYHCNTTSAKEASLSQEILKSSEIESHGLGPWPQVMGLSLNQPLWPREKDKPHSLRIEKRAVLQKKISMLLPRKRKLIPRKAKITNVFYNPSLPSYYPYTTFFPFVQFLYNIIYIPNIM